MIRHEADLTLEELVWPFEQRVSDAVAVLDRYEIAGVECDEDAWDAERYHELDMALLAVEAIIDEQDGWGDDFKAGLFCLDCGVELVPARLDATHPQPRFRCKECQGRVLGTRHATEGWSCQPIGRPRKKPDPSLRVPASHCPRGHPFTAENTGHQKAGRYCKTCKSERARARYHERRAR